LKGRKNKKGPSRISAIQQKTQLFVIEMTTFDEEIIDLVE